MVLKQDKNVDWIYLAQDTDKFRVLVNDVMNLGDHIKYGEFLH
jgi:hypothetical protein